MAFATNTNMMDYAPEVYEQGVDDWTAELGRAEQDVTDQVQIKWYNNHHNRSDFDKTLLVETQWTRATVYRALFAHVLPKLSTFRPEGDPFREQIEFYKERYAEELNTQFALGIKYDKNDDGNIDDAEVHEYKQDRLYR